VQLGQGFRDLISRADNVAEAADQLASVRASDWEVIVFADQPAQHGGGAVGAVLPIGPEPPLVRYRDLGLDV